ncbi:MAG TPA: heparan-alpha-glucosaminide N-acetyltransferase domain-containing protein [Polyangiaceae bacterium]
MKRDRAASIDLLRGVVMALMALDHVRDFFGSKPFDPTDLDKTTPALFFTRLVTHYCAPVFVLLAGTAAWLSKGKKSDAELTRFLLTRGLWLIFLEITANTFFWTFHPPFVPSSTLLVLWALGGSMIVLALALVCRLPPKVIAVIGATLVVFHDTLDHRHPFPSGPMHVVSTLLHEPGKIDLGALHLYLVYPLVPWCGVMMLGYALGARFAASDVQARSRDLVRIGLGLTVAFVVLRAVNVYGDPTPWHPRGGVFTLLAFLNVEKYPPSLDYLTLTLGPALLLLGYFDRSRTGEDTVLGRALVVLGRVPMFFYLIHVLVIHLLSNAVFFALEHRLRTSWTDRLDVGLPLVYVAWLAITAFLWLPSRWFANVKASAWGKTQGWLSYF